MLGAGGAAGGRGKWQAVVGRGKLGGGGGGGLYKTKKKKVEKNII